MLVKFTNIFLPMNYRI